jgi:hypothetical protein
MSSVITSYTVQSGDDQAEFEKKITQALVEAVKKTLDEIEATQIHKYTSTSNPALPAGSTYNRTFVLRQSSRKKITKTTLPTIKGQWRAIASYAEDVLGSRAQQEPIFQNRWKSTEEVEDIVQPKAEKIVTEELENIR